MRENREKNKDFNKKSISILGFLISIFLLVIAIILSMNEEKAAREARAIESNVNKTSLESVEQASSEIGKSVNEMKNINETINAINNEIDSKINSNNIQNDNNQNIIESENTNTSNIIENNVNINTTNESNVQNVISSDSKNETKEQFIKPVDGDIVSNYSMESLQYSNTLGEWITHRGIDIKADKTTVVKASADGTVKYIKEDPRYGLSITIEHDNGFKTVYSSLLSTEFVKEGDKVTQGQSIGTVGNSAVFESADGSHLHFEILKDEEFVNPDMYIK